MRHIILYTLIFIASYATAQIPGYQGLRFSVKYDCGINHPILMGRTGSLPMLYHNASIDYVVSRVWSVGVKYGYMTYNAPVPSKVLNSSLDAGDYYYGDIIDNKDLKGRYTQHTVGIIAKKFIKRKGYIAPVGRYITVGAYYQYATDHFVKNLQDYNSGGYYENPRLQGFKTIAHYGGITAGMGRNFVVANRLLFDLGFNINIALPTRDVLAQNGDLKKAAYTDLLLRNLFHLYLGFGVLAF